MVSSVKLLTSAEAAEILGVTPRRVLAMIHAGRLKAQQVGTVWVIRPKDLEKVRDRKPGRPPKDTG